MHRTRALITDGSSVGGDACAATLADDCAFLSVALRADRPNGLAIELRRAGTAAADRLTAGERPAVGRPRRSRRLCAAAQALPGCA
ncbi:hypothetical protein AB0I77_51965 [Streptomyces sp. NPDC050619]|uniref:hypothetical protein n=1 Tax=Streptomyces sp. NPDC050619 TaxID=3157214 RepID=UPI0034163BB8